MGRHGNASIYEKMEVDELLALYVSFEHVQQDHMDEFSKEEIYKLITCSVDIDNKLVMDLWKDYCRDYRDVEELQFHTRRDQICMIWKVIIKCWICIFSFPEKWDCPFRKKIC